VLAGFRDYTQIGGGKGNIFCAYASVTPAIYTGTTLTGPLLWNGSAVSGGRGVTAYLLATSFGLTVATTVPAAIGITGASGQVAAPTSITAIGAVANLRVGGAAAGPAPQCTAYAAGTVVNAGTFFLPIGHVQTGAITVATDDDNLVPLGGLVEVGVQGYAAVAAGATLTGSTIEVGLVWIEFPND
jgi:hypothetical protein